MDPFLVGASGIIFGCLIAVVAIIVSYYEEKKYMETIAKLVEAGKSKEEIEALLGKKTKFFSHHQAEKDPISYMKNGIIVMAIGAGVFVFGLLISSLSIKGIGIFLAILGLAFLLIYFLLNKKVNQN